MREGAAICVTTADEMAELAPLEAITAASPRAGGFAEGTRLLDAMSTRAPRVASDIAARAGLSIAEVQALLGQLELTGAVGERERGWLKVERKAE